MSLNLNIKSFHYNSVVVTRSFVLGTPMVGIFMHGYLSFPSLQEICRLLENSNDDAC